MRLLIATREGDFLYQTGVTTVDTVFGAVTTAVGVVVLENGTEIRVPDVVSVLGRGYWDIVADPVTGDAMTKERPKQFGSRSEAGRYAAQIRWGNQKQQPRGQVTRIEGLAQEATFDLAEAITTGRPYAPLMEENFPADLAADIQWALPWFEGLGNPSGDGHIDEDQRKFADIKSRLAEYYKQQLDTSGLSPELKNAIDGQTNQWYSEVLNDATIRGGFTAFSRRDELAQTMAWQFFESKRRNLAEGAHLNSPSDLKTLVSSPDMRLTVAADSHLVNRIITHGEIRNQFATRTSSGAKNYDVRAAHEAVAYGVHPLTLPQHRPIYGLVHPLGVQSTHAISASQYGDVQFVLKPSVVSRSTFTVGDSLSTGRGFSSATNPTRTLRGWNTPEETLNRIRTGQKQGYTEAQIHGGLKLSDISHVVINHGTVLDPKVVKRLEKLGIEIKFTSETEQEGNRPVTKAIMRRLIATLDGNSLYQTGTRVVYAGTALEENIPTGVIVDANGHEIEVSNVDSVLARGYWTVVADPFDTVEKGRPRQFASRSEAGRYAAQVRWGNRNRETPKGAHASGLALEPTDDQMEAITTGRPWSALLVENLPPETQAALAEVERQFSLGQKSFDKQTLKDQYELQKHLFSLIDPANQPAGVAYTADGRRLGINEDSRRSWAMQTSEAIFKGAAERGLVKHEGEQEALKYTQDVVKHPEMRLTIAINPQALKQLDASGDGRIKSQFETGSSGGHYDPIVRAAHESAAYAVHPFVLDSKRPIYGMVQSRGVRHVEADFAGQYGNVQLVLKPSVHSRATFSIDDSLGQVRNPQRVTGPVTRGQANPSWFPKDHAMHPSNRDSGIAKGGQVHYAEAQIHGGVSLGDVSHLVWSPSSWSSSKQVPPSVKQFAQKHGLKIVIAPIGKELSDGNTGWAAAPDPAVSKSVDAFLAELHDIVTKAAKRQFSSRSEAGRYAAQVRWGNRGGDKRRANITEQTPRTDKVNSDGARWSSAVFEYTTPNGDKVTLHASASMSGTREDNPVIYAGYKKDPRYGYDNTWREGVESIQIEAFVNGQKVGYIDANELRTYAGGNKNLTLGAPTNQVEITHVAVVDGWKRQGIATAMLTAAEHMTFDGKTVVHSTALTDMGAAFASAVKSADDMDKARQRQFSSRSEAGRYAAQIRWGNRSAGLSPSDTGSKTLDERVAALTARAEAEATKTVVDRETNIDELLAPDGFTPDNKPESARLGVSAIAIEQHARKTEKLGFDTPAQSATAEEADALVASGKFIVVYRGIGDSSLHDAYTHGKPPIGTGSMGCGTYTSTEKHRAEEYGEPRAYLVPKVGLTQERIADDAWNSNSYYGLARGLNGSFGISYKKAGTDDLLIFNIGMMIQAPRGWTPKGETTWAERHPFTKMPEGGYQDD